MISRTISGAVGGWLALWIGGYAQAAMMHSDELTPMPPQAQVSAATAAAAREFSSGWIAKPSGTSGGSATLQLPSWSLPAASPGPTERPTDSFAPEARYGFLAWSANSASLQLEPATPVPLPSAIWVFGSALLLLGIGSRRRGGSIGRQGWPS